MKALLLAELALQLALPLARAAPSLCESTPLACDPLILIPGVMASRLRSHTRREGSDAVESRHLWLPESHRMVFRTSFMAPVTGPLYHTWVNSLNPNEPVPGMRVEPDRSNFGVKGVSCILKTGRECFGPAKVFWDMIAGLEKLGYRAGRTLFGIPYDWRLPPTKNAFCKDTEKALRRAFNATGGRRALIVAHSLGNLQLLYCMQKVYDAETTSLIKGLVSIAAPFAGSPQVLRVLFSGAEMVSRYIISDAETRNFARQMGGVFMLLPDAKLWGNQSLMVLKGGEETQCAAPGAANAAAAAAVKPPPEQYTGASASLGELFSKVEAFAPGSPMRETLESTLELVDVWKAPPLPVVCVAATGVPTHTTFGYSEPWPRNMDEEPCILRYEEGDTTVPLRSMDAVCRHWAKQRRCHAPLTVAHASRYKGRHEECVDHVYLHCKDAAMASADAPRGADHCHNFHQAVLTKQPAIDLVASLATNPHAFEPHFSAARAAVREVGELLAWLYNGAAKRLDPAALGAALGNAPGDSDAPAGAPSASRFEAAVTLLASRDHYAAAMEAVASLQGVLRASDDGAAAGASVEPAVAALREAARPLVVAAREATDFVEAVAVGCAEHSTERAAAAGGDAGGDATSSEAAEAAAEAAAATTEAAAARRAALALQGVSTFEAAVPSFGSSAGIDAFEANVHAGLARAERAAADDRARATQPEWWCAMQAVATPHAEPLRLVRDQLESTLHQLRRVSARVLAPDAHRPPAEPVADGAKYASALYGQMPLPGEAWSETLGE